MLHVITKEPDEKTRGAWISQLLAMSGVIQQLANDDRLEKLLKFAQGNVGAVTNNQAIAGGNGISYAPVHQSQSQSNDLYVSDIGNVSVS